MPAPTDRVSPTVLSTLPVAGEAGVSLQPDITATFSEPMERTSLTPATFQLSWEETSIPGRVDLSGSTTATFVPHQLLALRGTYKAALTTGARDLAGNPLAADHAWTFTVRDGQWNGHGSLLAQNQAGELSHHQVALGPEGQALAVWVELEGSRRDLWTSRYVPTGGWSTPERLETNDAGNAFAPSVAFDAQGGAMVLWAQNDGTRTGIRARRYVPATGWEDIQRLDEDFRFCDAPRLALSPSGEAIAVWTEFDGLWESVWASRYVPGKGWEASQLIEDSDAGDTWSPQVAIDAAGHAAAVWSLQDDIWAVLYSPGSGWGKAQLIETQAGPASGPQVAINGRAFVTWTQYDGRRDAIWSNHFVPNTGWSLARKIDSESLSHSGLPRVAVDRSGRALSVWYQFDGRRTNILANRHEALTGWGTAQRIEMDEQGDATRPEVLVDPVGSALAVWQQWTGTRVGIWANRYTLEQGWVGATALDPRGVGTASWPRIAINAQGRALVLWQQAQDSRFQFMTTRFE